MEEQLRLQGRSRGRTHALGSPPHTPILTIRSLTLSSLTSAHAHAAGTWGRLGLSQQKVKMAGGRRKDPQGLGVVAPSVWSHGGDEGHKRAGGVSLCEHPALHPSEAPPLPRPSRILRFAQSPQVWDARHS